MTALLLGAWSRVQGWVLALGAVIALLGAAHMRGAQQARQAKALDDATQALRRREVRDEVDRDVARDADAAARLRDGWRRD